ncbi:MAG: ArsR/SmtB family transcription factor [Sarcina sp.]
MVNFRSVASVTNYGTLIEREKNENIYFGWKFKELLDNNETIRRDEKIFRERLKCLSDKSKFEILKLLKIKPLYGQEIAEKLDLTAATVSYHMNNLILSKLVYINKIENRVYYNLNNDEINKFLDKVKKELS